MFMKFVIQAFLANFDFLFMIILFYCQIKVTNSIHSSYEKISLIYNEDIRNW